MIKRIIALVLCLVMAISFMVACGDDSKTSSKKNSKSESKTTETATGSSSGEANSLYTDEEQAAIDKIVNDRVSELQEEAKDSYDGETFTMIGRKSEQSSAFPTEDEITGEKESDCVYERNKAVEDAFGITFDLIQTENGPEAAEQVYQDVDAGINNINMSFGNIWSTGTLLFSGGYLSEIGDYDQIDLMNPWWLETMEKYYAVGDKLFFLSGDILPNYFDNASCILYNKTVAENYSMTEDLYADVKDGTWTIDKMFETASVIPGGSDVKRYGNISGDAGVALLVGAGETITKFDQENMPYVESSLPAIVDSLATKVNAQTGDSSFCYNTLSDDWDDSTTITVEDLFVDNKILYMFSYSSNVAGLREKDVDSFGILPIPKYTEEQENYITYTCTGNDGSIYIPKNQKNNDFTGTILEAMGAYSYQKIRPVFYELRLKTQSVYDLASKEMLDIIYETQVYDLYDIYGDGSFYTGNGALFKLLNEAIYVNSDELSSGYASLAKTTTPQLKTFERLVKKFYGD